jgi:hypothetical protein
VDDEWAMKDFNSSVENRVEKHYSEMKTEENARLMHFAQVECIFFWSSESLARGIF